VAMSGAFMVSADIRDYLFKELDAYRSKEIGFKNGFGQQPL